MIPARAVEGWADLLGIAARHFDALADEAAPGSPEYLEFLALAYRCENAADYAGDEARRLYRAEDRAEFEPSATPAGADHARAPQ